MTGENNSLRPRTSVTQILKMADLIRRPEPMQSSPRSSPRDRGSRSPAYPRQDSSGTLKTTISLVPGKAPSVIHTGSFYLVKDIPGRFHFHSVFTLPVLPLDLAKRIE
ncbi:mediator of RNA polymerase II transcription subunit 19-A [Elysia marginata]|uniref:Mediator of RNA polymerase II transcription subunit 19-A n=1 Tax=Elysia marginata TaxID=1093978 RepID=A0AAV4HAK1_9GAST|nr:mediator of RNA polymerase II transcription subunit 19-A [Elysia marginata]